MMREIIFRASEDKLLEEQLKRRKSYQVIGAEHIRCDKCGGRCYVMPRMLGKIFECERCWAERRYKELVAGKEEFPE